MVGERLVSSFTSMCNAFGLWVETEVNPGHRENMQQTMIIKKIS